MNSLLYIHFGYFQLSKVNKFSIIIHLFCWLHNLCLCCHAMHVNSIRVTKISQPFGLAGVYCTYKISILEYTLINYITSIIVFMHYRVLIYWFKSKYQIYIAMEIYMLGAAIVCKKQNTEQQNLIIFVSPAITFLLHSSTQLYAQLETWYAVLISTWLQLFQYNSTVCVCFLVEASQLQM